MRKKNELRRVVAPNGVVEDFVDFICTLLEENDLNLNEASEIIQEKLDITVELYTAEFNRILKGKLSRIKDAWCEERESL